MLVRHHPAERFDPMRAILLSLSLLVATAFAPSHAQQSALPGLTEGVEYKLIADGKPYRAVPGKIEVAEVFAYWCGHCANFAPMLETWKRDLPKNVQLVYVPSASTAVKGSSPYHAGHDTRSFFRAARERLIVCAPGSRLR